MNYIRDEQLEIEVTCTSVQKLSACSELVKKSPHLRNSVAFDNFYRFLKTKNGKG